MKRSLRRTHCTLLTGSTGSEALTIARREKPDLVFLDAEMSGMTGIDVCRVLKADPALQPHPGHHRLRWRPV